PLTVRKVKKFFFDLRQMNILVRIGTVEDAAALSFIGEKTFVDTWKGTTSTENMRLYTEEIYSEATMRMELSDPVITYFVAFDDDKLVGYVKLSRKQTLGDWISDRCMELCRIYVLSDYLDKKVGKVLMEASIDLAKSEQMESMVLGVWENNHRALAFYKKFGFEKIGEHPFMVGKQVDTDWVMRKKL